MARKGQKPKAVNYQFITISKEPHQVLDQALGFHPELHSAKIGLAWRKSLKPDKDGRLVLGRCVKVSDLNKEFAEYDFIIVLNREVWEDRAFTKDKKLALMDHELCHAMPAEDSDGEHKEDERGRKVWRIRKHDIEEFQDVISRHGCYKSDLERFAEALLEKRKVPLLQAV